MDSIINKQFYYRITNPQFPGYEVINSGDRAFTVNRGRCTSYGLTVQIGGNSQWPITRKNILVAGDHILKTVAKEDEQEELEEKRKAQKSFFNRVRGFFE